MTDSVFGPPYCKIQTLWKRDPSRRNIIIPGEFSVPEHQYLWNNTWRWTEKIDGTNIRLYWNGRTVTLGGRTDNAQIPAFLSEAIREKNYLDTKIYQEVFGGAPATIFGEGYGPRIQKGGGLYRSDPDFIVFDVKVGQWWLKPEDVHEIAYRFQMDTVPLWGVTDLANAWECVKAGTLEAGSIGTAPLEGLVGTPAVPLFTRSGERLIVKLKVKDWEDYVRENGEA